METTEALLHWYVIYVDGVEGRKKCERFRVRMQADERAAALRKTAFARDVRVTSAR